MCIDRTRNDRQRYIYNTCKHLVLGNLFSTQSTHILDSDQTASIIDPRLPYRLIYCLNKERIGRKRRSLGKSLTTDRLFRQHPTVELSAGWRKIISVAFCQLTLHLSARRLSPRRGWHSPSTTAAGRPLFLTDNLVHRTWNSRKGLFSTSVAPFAAVARSNRIGVFLEADSAPWPAETSGRPRGSIRDRVFYDCAPETMNENVPSRLLFVPKRVDSDAFRSHDPWPRVQCVSNSTKFCWRLISFVLVDTRRAGKHDASTSIRN